MPAPLTEVGTSLDDVLCPFCSTVLQDAEAMKQGAEMTRGCEHVFMVAHDMAIVYLSDAAKAQLRIAGYTVNDSDPTDVQIESDDEDENRWAILDKAITGDEAKVLAVYAPPPVFDGSYYGVARSLR